MGINFAFSLAHTVRPHPLLCTLVMVYRVFSDNRALEPHEQHSSNHWTCDKCGLDVPIFIGLNRHYIKCQKHHYCGQHDKVSALNAPVIDLAAEEDSYTYCRSSNHIRASNPTT